VNRMLFLLTLLTFGCAAKRFQVDPTPTWTTHEGRDKAKLELAQALLDNGNPEAALQLVSQLQDNGTKHPEILVLQGKAMSSMGLTDDAEIVFKRAAKRHPSSAAANNELGILFMDQRDTETAIGHFRQAARAAPDDAKVHNNLGFALMAVGQNDEAITALRRALILDGSRERTRNNLGFALAAAGQDKAAWRVLRAGKDSASARYNLALAQELRGDLDAARTSYSDALSENPDLNDAKQALIRLEPDVTDSPDVSSTEQEIAP